MFAHCRSEYLAIQDADDIASLHRLWRQIATLRRFNTDMISSALHVWLQEGDPDPGGVLAARLNWEKICRPGRRFKRINPLGRCTNSLRLMTAELFRRMNGFGPMFCCGDFQFDNRCRYSGASIIDDQTILGWRRLHSGSLTGGPFKAGTAARDRDTAETVRVAMAMAADPTAKTARRFGALDKAAEYRQHLKTEAAIAEAEQENAALGSRIVVR